MAQRAMATARKQTALSTQHENSLLSIRVAALARMGMLRGAEASRETLALYSKELLSYEYIDVVAAAERIGRSPREEGESAFPDFGTFEREVKRARTARVDAERVQAEEVERRRLEEDLRLHPENYISVAELMEVVLERRRKRHLDSMDAERMRAAGQ